MTCKKNPLNALIRTRFEFSLSFTISNVRESVGAFVTATILIPSNPTNCLLNTLNRKVLSFNLHNCTNNVKQHPSSSSNITFLIDAVENVIYNELRSVLTLNVSQPEAAVRFATRIVPPPNSAQRYFFVVTDLN